jgi:pyruvate formate lyase activating enzyme
VFFEFAYDCCTLAAEQGLRNIFVSNGYMSEAATRELAPLLTAINIDIKSFRDTFYRKVCGARLKPVLDTVQLMHALGVWVEVTTLIISGKNDSVEELSDIAGFLADLDVGIPWHVTAFYPTYKMTDVPRTSVETLELARDIGRAAGLQYVYEGNIPGSGGENTICPSCSADVVRRHGFSILKDHGIAGCCPKCSTQIPGVWT